MMEIFEIVLQHSDTFYQTVLIDLSPVSIWNLDISDKSDSDWNCSF